MTLMELCTEMFVKGCQIRGWSKEKDGTEKISFWLTGRISREKLKLILAPLKPELMRLVKKNFPEPIKEDPVDDGPQQRSIIV